MYIYSYIARTTTHKTHSTVHTRTQMYYLCLSLSIYLSLYISLYISISLLSLSIYLSIFLDLTCVFAEFTVSIFDDLLDKRKHSTVFWMVHCANQWTKIKRSIYGWCFLIHRCDTHESPLNSIYMCNWCQKQNDWLTDWLADWLADWLTDWLN